MTMSPAARAAWGWSTRTSSTPSAPPASWARTNAGIDAGAIPAKVSEKARPTMTAGFANDVELVNQYAAPM